MKRMLLNFKTNTLLFFIIAITYIANGQEEAKKEIRPLGNLKIGFLTASSFGNSFVSKGYNLMNGALLSGRYNFDQKWHLGAQFTNFRGEVSDISQVGAIESTSFSHFHFLAGYSLFKRAQKLAIITNIGMGIGNYQHRQDATKFKDSGFSIMGNILISYRFSQVSAIYLQAQSNWDFLSINTPPENKDFFNDVILFLPSVGLTFNIF